LHTSCRPSGATVTVRVTVTVGPGTGYGDGETIGDGRGRVTVTVHSVSVHTGSPACMAATTMPVASASTVPAASSRLVTGLHPHQARGFLVAGAERSERRQQRQQRGAGGDIGDTRPVERPLVQCEVAAAEQQQRLRDR